MLEFSESLGNTLKTAPTKSAWSSVVLQALAGTRTLSVFHDVNSGVNPVTSGVEVIRTSLEGQITVSGGNIGSFGKTKTATIKSAANLLVGKAVLRIMRGEHWVQGTVGLTRTAQTAKGVADADLKDYDFTLTNNPSMTTGIGFGSFSGIKAPAFLPSGTGAVAPNLTADSVVAFRVMDYKDEANPVSAGIAMMSQRDPDIVMDHPWMAQEYGDVRVMRCPDNTGVVFGTGGDCFRFAGTVLHQSAATNSEANVPLQQVKINAVPHGRWLGFPFKGGLDVAYDTLIPGPHKIELLRSDGSIADVIEMYSTRDSSNTPGSGKPVNYSGQTPESPYGGIPAKAFWTCQMVHEWWSHRPKYFSKVDHLIPGVNDDSMHPKNLTELASQNECWPVFTGKNTLDGLNCWPLSPKWGRPANGGFDTDIINPYWSITQATRDSYITQIIGRGFEPGSTGGHTWYMAPGGPRADRAPWPSTVVAWVTYKDGIRPHGAVPYKEMLHDWNMNYMNHGCHYFTNLERGLGIPRSKVLNGDICYNNTYYGGSNENFREDINNNAVRLLSAYNGNNVGQRDKNGRRFANEWSRDYQHSQNTAATGAYTYISASHVLEARHSFTSHILAAFGLSRNFSSEDFLTRQHAWHMWQAVNTWIVGNNSERGFTASEIEGFTRRHLESVYDSVMSRYNSTTDIYGKTLRVLGQGSKQVDNSTTGMSSFTLLTDSKAHYFAQVLLLWKQSGFFALMHAKSEKCAAVLDLIIESSAKFSVNVFVEANGRPDQVGYSYSWPIGTLPQFESWADVCPPQGQADWIRKVDGTLKPSTGAIDTYITMHLRGQMVHVLRDYFPEYNIPNVDQAATIVDGFYKTISDGIANGTTGKFKYRYPMMGIFKKAAKIGAI